MYLFSGPLKVEKRRLIAFPDFSRCGPDVKMDTLTPQHPVYLKSQHEFSPVWDGHVWKESNALPKGIKLTPTCCGPLVLHYPSRSLLDRHLHRYLAILTIENDAVDMETPSVLSGLDPEPHAAEPGQRLQQTT
ncbi:hypothetical protein AVEN_243395-1 [Araneus ventricosus]|uniref:Uncharacterized protein n=1 Tax=Araneus ventricosus TaxID=182803 RepID=A0A4Y2SI85_ARAVE|nr:hypothetical protein AVEN_243395-1 [Araneus ventricosus]